MVVKVVDETKKKESDDGTQLSLGAFPADARKRMDNYCTVRSPPVCVPGRAGLKMTPVLFWNGSKNGDGDGDGDGDGGARVKGRGYRPLGFATVLRTGYRYSCGFEIGWGVKVAAD